MPFSPGNLHAVTNFYCSANQNFREDSFFGHNTISHGIKYIAPVMADLAYLRNFQQHFVSNFQFRADGKLRQINALYRKIFREIPVIYIKTLFSDFINALFRKKTNLPDSGFRVSVVFQPKIFQKQTTADIILPFSLFTGNIDRQNFSAD